MDSHWGHDPVPHEDSRTLQSQLKWLFAFAVAGAAPAAYFGTGTEWKSITMSAVASMVMMCLFAKNERLAVVPAIVPGVIAGIGGNFATATYLANRLPIMKIELIIPGIVGVLPGVLLFIVFQNMFHRSID